MTKKGKHIPAVMLPRETYFEMSKTIANIPIEHKAAQGNKPNPTPNNVATPFPPLKLAKTGNVCPKTTATADIRMIYGEMFSPLASSYKMGANNTEINPFSMSMNRTGRPAFKPSIRMVFVAPELPEPCVRTSTSKNSFPIQTAVGIDPNK